MNSKNVIAAVIVALIVLVAFLGYGLYSVQQVVIHQSEEIGQLTGNLRDLERQVTVLTEAILNRSSSPSVDLASLYLRVRDSVVVVQGIMVQIIDTIFGPMFQYAPINSGNSGGPLLNAIGEVVGITTAIISGSQGVGLAIPSDTIRRELPDLVSSGTYDMHSWMGVGGIDVSPDIVNALNLSKTYGWLITSLTSGGPAENAGIRAGTRQVQVSGTTVIAGGDVIIALNGVRIRNGDDLSAYLEASTLPGQTIQVTILRDNDELTIPLVLGKRPSLGS